MQIHAIYLFISFLLLSSLLSAVMDDQAGLISSFIVSVVVLILSWKLVNWAWLSPKKIEKVLRQQGLKGSSYKLLIGDAIELLQITKKALSKPINLDSDDALPRIVPFFHHIVQKHGNNSFAWIGTRPWLIVTDVELVKEILMRYEDFVKPSDFNPLFSYFIGGLLALENQKWAKHRKIINPAFHQRILMTTVPAMHLSCGRMLSIWEEMVMEGSGSAEFDIWPHVENLSGDVISMAAFNCSGEEGRKIMHLQDEQAKIIMQLLQSFYIPGWKFLPTKTNQKMKGISKEVEGLLTTIIEKRRREMESGQSTQFDLLGTLLDSNMSEIKKGSTAACDGLTLEEVVQECKGFYVAGHESTSSLLAWTLVLLSKHQDWQDRARVEVSQICGNKKPEFDALNRLKVVNMILQEVLRLYPPGFMTMRKVFKDTKLKNLLVPAGTEFVIPICLLHQDTELWGNNAKEFHPERFSEGVIKATKGRVSSFIPFSMGPRICIGQNFALLEAKMAIAMILQRFSFQLSPAYIHAPYTTMTIKPQYGANLVVHKL